MEDLDLDELHQAVSKMMAKPEKGKKPAHHGGREPAAIKPPVRLPVTTDTAHDDPKADPAPEPPAATPSPSVRPMPTVPQRHRTHPGAMDIIPPATTPKLTPPSGNPSRTGVALRPPVAAPAKTPAPQPAVPAQPATTAEPPVPSEKEVTDEVLASLRMQEEPGAPRAITKPIATPAPAQPESKPANSWPDPLDFHDFGDADKSAKPSTPEPSQPATPAEPPEPQFIAQTQPDTAPTMSESSTEPPTNPFVTTKVEKRPLGAYSATASAEPPATAPAPSPHPDTDKSDLASVAIESNQHVQPPDGDSADMHDLRQMAIPPQYHTAEPAPSDEVHNVYDTKEYHAAPQQMMHPAKRQGSPWFVITFVVLLVLLVGAAVVAYLMLSGTVDFSKIL